MLEDSDLVLGTCYSIDYCIMQPARRHLTKRKKPKPFRAVDAVKAAARDKIGAPPPTRRVPDAKKERREKHKATLDKLLREES